MRYFLTLLVFLLSLFGTSRFASAAEQWDDPVPGLQPEARRLHVVSSVQKSSGTAFITYTVDAWYFDREVIIRIRSANSDMIGYEDKTKSQAAYWEKGIDTSTPYFPKEFLDGFLTDLVAHADIWFYQQPIRKLMEPQAARTERDSDSSLTTITLRISNPAPGVTNYLSAAYRDNNIIAMHTAGDLNDQIKDAYVVEYRDHDPKTGLPRLVSYQSRIPPYTTIRHKTTLIEPIPANVSVQSLLAELSKGYRPVTMRMLNDPGERVKWSAGSFQNLGFQIAAAGAAIAFLIFASRRASRRGKR